MSTSPAKDESSSLASALGLTKRVPVGLRLALSVLLGAAAWVCVLPLIPSVTRDIGTATVAARAGVGSGSTSFVAPPLGRVSADTHDVPINLDVLLAEVDVAELQKRLGRGESISTLSVSVEENLRALARRLFVQLAVAGALAGMVAALILPHRRVRTIVAASAGGTLAAVAVMSLTSFTFDERAFEQPRFTGALRRAPEVIEAANRGIESFEALGSRYEALAQRLSRIMALASDPGLDVQEEAVSILHVSDIHSNPLGIEFVNRLVRAFEVDAVLDTGDLTSFGDPLERRLSSFVAGVPAPYLFVPGNHDSRSNRVAMAALPNVSLLDGDTEVVDGVRVLGWGDPTFTARSDIATDEANRLRAEEADDVWNGVLESRPDILAVHDVRLASDSLGEVDLVLAGHSHERALDEISGSIVATVGSSGATGLGSFTVESDIPYEAEVVYLQPGGRVIIDYIRFSGLAEEFDVERRVVDTS